MSIVAEFTIPTTALPGGDALSTMPGVTIQLERVVPADEGALPFFWMYGGDPDEFLDALRIEPNVEEIEVLAEVDRAALFSATWTPDDEVVRGIQTLGATIMEATATVEEWHFQVRADNRKRLREFQRIFRDQGIPVELVRIYDLARELDVERPLTAAQRETLLVAHEKGYFDRPRQVTQAELGDYFDISSQAVATRIQRGTKNLVRQSLLSSPLAPDRLGY